MGKIDKTVITSSAAQRAEINARLMEAGVVLIDPAAAYIDGEAVIAPGVTVYPGVFIEGRCVIGAGSVIYQGSRLVRTSVGEDTTVQNSVLMDAVVGDGCEIGPYAYLRPGSVVGNGCKVGDFVELKSADIGDGAKVSHLTYIGDAQVGKRANIGCGTVFVNYDGRHKYRTSVGDDCFIGCNTNLVAPVSVGEGAFTAAGSTITEDVPAHTLAVARARQVVKTGWKPPKERD